MRKRILTGFALVLLVSAAGFADENWTPEKMMTLKMPSGTAISPDGAWVAFSVTEIILAGDRSEFLTHIWLALSDGSRAFQLTRGEKSCFAPSWSPDGKWLAFMSVRGGKPDIWLIRPDGGEALQLTDAESGVGFYKWSPDSLWIAFKMTDPATEEEKSAKKAKNDPILFERNYKYNHLYKIRADVLSAKRPEPVRLTGGTFDVANFDWSPDGGSIVFSFQATPRINDWGTADISIVSSEGGEVKPLIAPEGMDDAPLFSPDGKRIAFITNLGTIPWPRDWRICLFDIAKRDNNLLPPTFDRMVGTLFGPAFVGWAPDSSGVYYTEWERGHQRLYFAPADGSPYRAVTPPEGIMYNFSITPDCRRIAFVSEDFSKPGELYVADLDGAEFKPVKLTNLNGQFADMPYPKSEMITWESVDGAEIEGILHYPLNYEEGKRYPLILNPHGGPSALHGYTYIGGDPSLPVPIFCERGFFILQPNPRGSGGYGWEHRSAITADWGGLDYDDVMAGVDHVIALGLADPQRLGVTGWSYGGFLTSLIITKTNRFKAAAPGAGMSDMISFVGTTDIFGFIPGWFRGEPWEKRGLYMERSAIFNVEKVTTPTLILFGENDARVPVSQGYEFYRALQRRGVDVQLVLYPRSGHGVAEPRLIVDLMNRMLDFFTEKLKP